MSQTLEEFRARMKRELSAAANEDLKAEVQRVQKARGCSFDDAWRRTEREHPMLFSVGAVAGSSSDPESPQSYLGVEARARAQRLIYESGGSLTMGEALSRARMVVNGSDNPGTPKDPRVEQEMAKHKKFEERKKSAAIDDHVGRMARIRELMAEKNRSFDQAFTEICKQETAAKPPASAALTTSVGTVKAIVPTPRDKALEAAGRKGLIYIEGGNCDWFIPLPGTREE